MPELFHQLQQTDWATALRESALVYPVVMSLHLSAIALFVGMIAMTNLRLLNFVFRGNSAAEVFAWLRPWKWAAFAAMVSCGFLLAASKADGYYPNPYFRIKMALLALAGVHALVFRRDYARPKLAACLSLVIWGGILCMGRWIAYYEAPKPEVAERLSRVAAASVHAPPRM